MQQKILSFKLCKCHQTGGKCFIESGFAICQFRKTSYFGESHDTILLYGRVVLNLSMLLQLLVANRGVRDL